MSAASGDSLTVDDLVAIFAEVFNHADATEALDFFASGGRAAEAGEIFSRIEQRTGRQLPTSLLLRAPTPSQLHLRLADYRDTTVEAVLDEGTRPPVFLLPDASSSAIWAHPFCEGFGAGHPTYALRLPHFADIARVPSIESLASTYIEALCEVAPTGPIILYGFSMGGIIGFEMTKQLEARGRTVIALGMGDSPSPPRLPGARLSKQVRSSCRELTQATWNERRAVARMTVALLLWHLRNVAKSFLKELRRGRVTVPQLFLRQIRHRTSFPNRYREGEWTSGWNLMDAAYRYELGAPVAAPIVLIRVHPLHRHDKLGWEGHSRTGTIMEVVEGSHLYFEHKRAGEIFRAAIDARPRA
ncbi:thioesterase domain-containing protein [Humibacter sp.]|uniref:thioesterase domain-containing protein n=1 Tax=Humibacter sp. TaxID=1940291 RepID=UPI002BC92662|nr:thioesterase domain-containing protein [Humibacter sp.]HVX07927.1 thioesterase domain-containing protein [Humibacter sp.]